MGHGGCKLFNASPFCKGGVKNINNIPKKKSIRYFYLNSNVHYLFSFLFLFFSSCLFCLRATVTRQWKFPLRIIKLFWIYLNWLQGVCQAEALHLWGCGHQHRRTTGDSALSCPVHSCRASVKTPFCMQTFLDGNASTEDRQEGDCRSLVCATMQIIFIFNWTKLRRLRGLHYLLHLNLDYYDCSCFLHLQMEPYV